MALKYTRMAIKIPKCDEIHEALPSQYLQKYTKMEGK
jgi:hypothetical protein